MMRYQQICFIFAKQNADKEQKEAVTEALQILIIHFLMNTNN